MKLFWVSTCSVESFNSRNLSQNFFKTNSTLRFYFRIFFLKNVSSNPVIHHPNFRISRYCKMKFKKTKSSSKNFKPSNSNEMTFFLIPLISLLLLINIEWLTAVISWLKKVKLILIPFRRFRKLPLWFLALELSLCVWRKVPRRIGMMLDFLDFSLMVMRCCSFCVGANLRI